MLLGLNVLNWLKSGAYDNESVVLPLFHKTENFLSPQLADADYRLLADVLPLDSADRAVRTDINSATCMANDDSIVLQLGGDYSQRTNNYHRIFPDSCSAPRHEFLLDFYKLPADIAASPIQKPIQAVSPKC